MPEAEHLPAGGSRGSGGEAQGPRGAGTGDSATTSRVRGGTLGRVTLRGVRAQGRDGKMTVVANVGWLLAAVVAPIGLVALAAAAIALHSAVALGGMLFGWHHVKRGLGVAALLSARRVDVHHYLMASVDNPDTRHLLAEVS